eukprot:CAMPEP_0180629496 /NCGR_PEP_ID=MMETSP1037_2-20121125/39494_1 /TAXON_ID=632150 /ORGANISM="Azadinium spinosum, Strain 3D9" /LENGTH=35 /DNA_ID= /DNA_START= /DNA_END= /DNA_ORIENTATION=
MPQNANSNGTAVIARGGPAHRRRPMTGRAASAMQP